MEILLGRHSARSAILTLASCLTTSVVTAQTRLASPLRGRHGSETDGREPGRRTRAPPEHRAASQTGTRARAPRRLRDQGVLHRSTKPDGSKLIRARRLCRAVHLPDHLLCPEARPGCRRDWHHPLRGQRRREHGARRPGRLSGRNPLRRATTTVATDPVLGGDVRRIGERHAATPGKISAFGPGSHRAASFRGAPCHARTGTTG